MSTSAFTILSANIILSSPNGRERIVDISKQIIEVTFYESLYTSYVDGRIVMLDDFGLRTELSVQGTERIQLVIGVGSDTTPVIDKIFFFSKVNDVEKMNERSEILSVDLVEEHVYVNAIKSLSRSYTDTLENMVINIADRDLGKPVVKTAYFEPTPQAKRRIIIPYMSPLEAMSWIQTRMTTKIGSPIYVYGDLYSNSLYMAGLDGLLSEKVINEKMPLRYNDAISAADGDQEFIKTYYQVTKFTETDAEDALALYEEGAVGSFYANIDAGTGQTFGTHITVRDVIDDFYTYGLIDKGTSQSVFDPSLVIDGRPADEYNSLHIHQVTSSRTYNQYKSYHDEAQLIEGNTPFESRLKIKNKIIRQILKKNQIDIEMDGGLFLEKKISPSRKMRIIFLSPNTNSNVTDMKQSVDKRKSGDYLLTNVMHRMSNDNHVVNARLIKLGDLPSDFTI